MNRKQLRSYLLKLLVACSFLTMNAFARTAEPGTLWEKVKFYDFDGATTLWREADTRLDLSTPGDKSDRGTIEFWVMPVAFSPFAERPCILSNGSKDARRFSVHLTPTCDGIGINNGEGFLALPFNFLDFRPHHVAMVIERDLTRVYIDGEFLGAIYQGFGETKGHRLYVGSQDGKQCLFRGQIGDVRLWNRALHAKEIRAHMGAGNADLNSWVWSHPDNKFLAAYSIFGQQGHPGGNSLRFSSPIAGIWIDESDGLPRLLKPLPEKDDTKPEPTDRQQKLFEQNNHGNYKAPSLYCIVTSEDPTLLYVYRNGLYYGQMKKKDKTGQDEIYDFFQLSKKPVDKKTVAIQKEAATEFTLNGPLLRSARCNLEIFGNSPGGRISLVRPTRKSDSFNTPVTVNLEDQFIFDQIAQLYPCNYKCYNLRKMDPFNMVHTNSGSSYFAFELPDGEFQVSADGILAPRDLHVFSRREGGGGFESIVTTSTEELASTMMSRTGFQADAQILGVGGGTTKNREVGRRTSQMLQNESGKAFFWSTSLQYALVADRSHLRMNDRLRNRIQELYQEVSTGSLNEQNKTRAFVEFFEEVGTHYPHAVTYGGLMMFESSISRELQEFSIKNNLNLEEQIRMGIDLPQPKGVNLGSASIQETEGSEEGDESTFRSELRKEQQDYWVLGGGGILMSPENPEAVELDGRVAPIYMDLRPLEELLSPQYFGDTVLYHEFRKTFRDQLCCYLKGTTDDASICDCNKPTTTNAKSWPLIEIQVLPGTDPTVIKLEMENFPAQNVLNLSEESDSGLNLLNKKDLTGKLITEGLIEEKKIKKVRLQFLAQPQTEFPHLKKAPSGRRIDGEHGHAVILSDPLSKPEADNITPDLASMPEPHLINPANDAAILAQGSSADILKKTGFDTFHILKVKYPNKRDPSAYLMPLGGLIIGIIDLATGKDPPTIENISVATRARLGLPEPKRFQGPLEKPPAPTVSTLGEDELKGINVSTIDKALLATLVKGFKEYSAGLRWSFYLKPYTSTTEQTPQILFRAITTVELPNKQTKEFTGEFKVLRPTDLLNQESLIFQQPGCQIVVKSPLGKLTNKKITRFELSDASGTIGIPKNLNQASVDASLEENFIPVSPRNIPFRKSVVGYWPFDHDLLERSGRGDKAFRSILDSPETLISENAILVPDNIYLNSPPLSTESKRSTIHCDFKIGNERAATILEKQAIHLLHLHRVPFVRFDSGRLIPLTNRLLIPKKWHKLIMTIDEENRQMQVMINGELLKEIQLPLDSLSVNTTDESDSEEQSAERYWQIYGENGKDHCAAIDEFLVYDRVLTLEEMELLTGRPRLRNQRLSLDQSLWEESALTNLSGCWESPNISKLLSMTDRQKKTITKPSWIIIEQAGPNLLINPVNSKESKPFLGVINSENKIIFSTGPIAKPHIYWPGRFDDQINRIFVNEWQLAFSNESLVSQQNALPPLERFAWKRIDLNGPWRDVQNQVDIKLTQDSTRLKAILQLSDEKFQRKTTGTIGDTFVCSFMIDALNNKAAISEDLNHIRFKNGLTWSRMIDGKIVPDPETDNTPKPDADSEKDPKPPKINTPDLAGQWCNCSSNDLIVIKQTDHSISLRIVRSSGNIDWKNGQGTVGKMSVKFSFEGVNTEAKISKDNQWIRFPSGAVWKRLHPRNQIYNRISKVVPISPSETN